VCKKREKGPITFCYIGLSYFAKLRVFFDFIIHRCTFLYFAKKRKKRKKRKERKKKKEEKKKEKEKKREKKFIRSLPLRAIDYRGPSEK